MSCRSLGDGMEGSGGAGTAGMSLRLVGVPRADQRGAGRILRGRLVSIGSYQPGGVKEEGEGLDEQWNALTSKSRWADLSILRLRDNQAHLRLVISFAAA